MSKLVAPVSLARVRHARSFFFAGREIPHGHLDDTIARSWRRCAEAGLEPAAAQQIQRIAENALREVCEGEHALVHSAQPVMENLYEHIANSGSMVILTDAHGLILHACGDADFLNKAERVALKPGACWAETDKGTNAIGTAIAEHEPVVVHGPEHYFERNTFLTCSASPIYGPDGGILGVLDISGDYRSYRNQTLPLVRVAAQFIENRLLQARAEGAAVFMHPRAEFLGSWCEGIVVFSPDGRLRGANRAAVSQLGTSHEQLHGRDCQSLFGLPYDALLDSARRAEAPLVLHPPNGATLYAHVKARTVPSSVANPLRPVEAPRNVGCDARVPLDDLATGDPRMRSAVEKSRHILGRDIPLLIEGESGVGKELFATAFHHSGPRRDRPFVALNCAAIPEGLIESELFGYEGGAFTGARRKGCPGRIQQAHGGTLFLDEIGDMPLNLQARLLRVLEQRTVVPLGGTHSIPVDISLVCATNHRIRDDLARGTFRADLYYRVNGLHVTLPPLRARTDLDEMVQRLVLLESNSGSPVRVAGDVMDLFRHHSWPGNVRQLRNVIRTALALLDGTGDVIRRQHLPEDFLQEIEMWDETRADARVAPVACAPTAPVSLEALELAAIRKALQTHAGNVSAAARELGISRNTLYRKLRGSPGS